ncbi:MAG: crossover junction endodeoxyribonuclease RuvC [Gammaproteobacteria bacterium]
MSPAVRILGIDPGSRVTGYGIVDVDGPRTRHVANGRIETVDGELPARLKCVFQGVTAIIRDYGPTEMAIEKVFINRNVDSALKLGQARGVAMVAGANADLPVHEYSPREVKLAIVGRGGAEKEQIQHMVRVILALSEAPPADAADALAIALCHAHTRQSAARVPAARAVRRGRYV